MFSRLDLNGCRVILTGASSGIGRALAPQLAEQGARLVLASRNAERLAELARGIRDRGGEAHVVPTDVTDPADRTRLVEQAVAHLGGLDILVNNAGVGAMGFFQDAGEDRLRRIFEVNFFACTELTRLSLPHVRQSDRAMVVNVSSVIGRRGVPGCTEYCASKFALCGWSEGLRAELARHRVHVLLVCPGLIETEFKQNMIEDKVRFDWQQRRTQTADQCAAQIVKAMRRWKNELVTTAEGKLLLVLNRLLPRWIDYYLARFGKPLRQEDNK